MAAPSDLASTCSDSESGDQPGLMDNHGDVDAFESFTAKGSEQKQGGGAVQTRCRLIQDQHRRLHHHLEADIDSLALAARDATLLHRPNQRISNWLQPKGLDDPFHDEDLISLGHVCRQPETHQFIILEFIR